ncbi:MAG: sensor histidine kinase [Sphingomicrobium sp.]
MAEPPLTAAALLGALDDPTLMVVGSIIASANPAAKQLFGAIEGRDIRLAVRQPDALALIAAGEDADAEVAGIGRVGQPWHLTVRRLAAGTVLVRLADRSEVVSAERLRVDFVANASHELRTPLSTIMGYAETLSDDFEGPPELRSKFATIILEESRRMLRLVEDLMDLSRVQADRYDHPTQLVSIPKIAMMAIANAAPLLTDGAAVETELADSLPLVRGDESQLLQVLDNLLTNAIRYGHGAMRGSRVVVRAAHSGNRVRVSVSDEGPGIAREHLPRLTERFYRVDAARSRHSGGTGLGLAIVKHVVERHRGTLEINSEVGTGTTVTFALPAAG